MMMEYLRASMGTVARKLAKPLGNDRGAEIIEIALWIAIVAGLVLAAAKYGSRIVDTAWTKAENATK